ncbi:transposase [Aeromonas phage phiA019]|nr:transposase [Aeromonas phage phiA009]ULG01667.1 transposase [Aeromonas phage phiA019]
MKEILRSYKFRIYPNAEQKEQLAQTFGCARFVYNWALSNKKEAYENNIKKSANDVSKELTALKKDPNFIWLKDVSSVCLQQSLMNLDNAYQRFFKKQGGFPTFKKRSNRQSARYVKSAFTFKNGQLKLAKQDKFMKVKFSRPLTGDINSLTVSKDPDGKYYVSFLVKETYQPPNKSAKQIAIDLGIKDFATFSDGSKVANPNHLFKSLSKLKGLQRNLSRKKKGSKNRNKARIKLARLHSKIANQRSDFLHKLSTQIVNENQVICVEDLAVKEMLQQNKLIAKLARNLGWRNFLTMLEYKSGWNERQFIKVDRWFASSKTCSACGSINKELKLSQRSWVCSCGAKHDRDHNAAKNILREGLKDIH